MRANSYFLVVLVSDVGQFAQLHEPSTEILYGVLQFVFFVRQRVDEEIFSARVRACEHCGHRFSADVIVDWFARLRTAQIHAENAVRSEERRVGKECRSRW